MTKEELRREFSQWLEKEFIGWIAETNQRHTVTEFADYLNVPRQKLSRWLQGTLLPAGENIHILASKLGPEVYLFLNFPHPDNRVQTVVHNWYLLNSKEQEMIYQICSAIENSTNTNIKD